MPIKPADMQVLVGRAQEVDRMQQTRDAAQMNQQQALGLQARVEAEHQRAMVRGTPQSARGRVQRREEAPDEKRRRRAKGRPRTPSGGGGGQGQVVGGHIDIKL